MDQEPMSLSSRFLAAAAAGTAAFLAVGSSPPQSHREGAFRIGTGVVFGFCLTGASLDYLGKDGNSVNAILSVALFWGIVGWWLMAALIKLAQTSAYDFLHKIASVFVGSKTFVEQDAKEDHK